MFYPCMGIYSTYSISLYFIVLHFYIYAQFLLLIDFHAPFMHQYAIGGGPMAEPYS